MNGTCTLYIDQYGTTCFARKLADLKDKFRGRISKMYIDKTDGSTVHVGYVIGHHWLTAYRPLKQPA